MVKISAGLLMYKFVDGKPKFFIGHPGGPFWKDKDEEAWSIIKGEVEEGEDFFECAKREFEEETGIKVKSEKFIELGQIKQKSGKIVHAWAFEGDWSGLLKQFIIEIEWPPRSGKKIKIPEIDKVGFFPTEEAKKKLINGQDKFIDRLIEKLTK